MITASSGRIVESDFDRLIASTTSRAVAVAALGALAMPGANTATGLARVLSIGRKSATDGLRLAAQLDPTTDQGGRWVFLDRAVLLDHRLTHSQRLAVLMIRLSCQKQTRDGYKWLPGQRHASGLWRRCRAGRILTIQSWIRTIKSLPDSWKKALKAATPTAPLFKPTASECSTESRRNVQHSYKSKAKRLKTYTTSSNRKEPERGGLNQSTLWDEASDQVATYEMRHGRLPPDTRAAIVKSIYEKLRLAA